MNDTTKFTIECEMKTRWVPHFLGMLKKMEQLGGLGSSRPVGIYVDGDGDFRPKFKWDDTMPEVAKPLDDDKPGQSPRDKGYMFDAG